MKEPTHSFLLQDVNAIAFTSLLRYFQSNKRKIAEGKISLSTFIQTTPPSVAALQCYSSKTSNAKLKKKFILYIYNMAYF